MLQARGRYTLGEWTCTPVTDGTMPYPARNLFYNAAEAELDEALRAHGIEGGQLNLPFNPLLLRDDRETVLIDAGFGPGVAPSVGHIVESLAAEGVAPEDVTVLILSHGHSDHSGGAITADGAPAFPNARIYLDADEAAFWRTDLAEQLAGRRAAPARRVVEALDGIFRPIEPGRDILPGIRAVPSPGHTPHNAAIRIESGGQALYYVADGIPHAITLEHPDWTLEPDLDPGRAAASRRALMQRIADEGALVHAYHFPLPSAGRLRPAGAAFRWEPIDPAPRPGA